MEDLTAFQRDILHVTAGQEEPHGLAIKDTLDDYYDQNVNHGRLYPNLDELTDRGLLKKGKKDKRTNQYTLTERGLKKLKARRSWEPELLDGAKLNSV